MPPAGYVTGFRGRVEIARGIAAMWERERAYVSDPVRVHQAGDTALIIARGAVSAARRQRGDGHWRYAITLLHDNNHAQRSNL